MPAAPLLFSTTTDCCHFSPSFAAMVRAEMSVPPPGGKGTMNVTGFAGYPCAPASATQKNRVRPHLRIAPLKELTSLLDDRFALGRSERLEVRRPGLAVLVIRQPRRLAPAPRGMPGLRAAAEDMHVHAPMLGRALLLALRRRRVVQRPVARLEVIHAAAVELRQDIDHGAADGADEEAPVRKIERRELALLPDVLGRIDDQMAAIQSIEEHHLRQHHRAARAFVDDA